MGRTVPQNNLRLFEVRQMKYCQQSRNEEKWIETKVYDSNIYIAILKNGQDNLEENGSWKIYTTMCQGLL